MVTDTSWKLHHIGIVVRDMAKAIERYRLMGIGPFEAPTNPLDVVERKFLYKPIDVSKMKLLVKFADIGLSKLELLQPLEGESLWKEFLDTQGEGLSHLGFTVDNIEREEAKLLKEGFRLLYRSKYRNGGGALYFDTGVGSAAMEIIQY